MAERTTLLAESSRQFATAGRRLKSTMWWRNARMQCLVVVAALVLLLIVLGVGCGPSFCLSRHGT